MKYAENNRISHRQLYRQILLTFLAPFLLCLNGKGGLLGLSGAVGIILAVIFLLLYSFFYLRSTYGYADMLRSFGKVRAVIFGDFFLIYLVMAGAYLLNLIGRIIPVWMIFGISEKWLLLFAVSVCAWNGKRTAEKRQDGRSHRRKFSRGDPAFAYTVCGTGKGRIYHGTVSGRSVFRTDKYPVCIPLSVLFFGNQSASVCDERC